MASKPIKYENHPLADIFPMMEESDIQALAADIKANGLVHRGMLYEGKILDGRNRYAAWLRVWPESDFDFVVWEDNWDDENPASLDPLAFVLSENLHRRHLTTSQRAMVAANIAKVKQGDGGPGRAKGQICTIDDAAKQLNVSPKSVKNAKRVKDKGTPELAAMVTDGKVSVDAASKVAKKTKAEQEAIVSKGPKAVKEAAKTVPKNVSKGGGVKKQVEVEQVEVPKPHNFLKEFKELWSRADESGRAKIREWLSKQTIAPELSKSKQSKSKDGSWRAPPKEVIVEVQS